MGRDRRERKGRKRKWREGNVEFHHLLLNNLTTGCKHVCSVLSGSHIENWHSIVRRGPLNASNTELEMNGANEGAGIYLSPSAQISLRFSTSRINLPAVCICSKRRN